MKVGFWLLAALLGMAVAVTAGAATPVYHSANLTMFAGSGGGVLAASALAAWLIGSRKGRCSPFDVSLATAMPEWRAGRRSALEGMVAEFAGPAATAHALRCSALADRLAEQLALPPAETEDLVLAGALHVLPVAFPDREDGPNDGCRFGPAALVAARTILARAAPPSVARIALEVCERWDGTGLPDRLAGEQCSLAGRILAVACRFDHESGHGLENGLSSARAGSSTAFDPVVVAELIHLFREPWQSKVAA